MTKEEKFNQCRYYHGEEKEPDNYNQNEKMFWFYEHCWIERNDHEKDMVKEYVAYGLEHFSENDGVDISFKALLFYRYYHFSTMDHPDYKGFKEMYLKEYLKNDV